MQHVLLDFHSALIHSKFKSGWKEHLESVGQRQGELLILEEEHYANFVNQFKPDPVPPTPRPLPKDPRLLKAQQKMRESQTTFGLGDLIGMVATPIARALGAGCVDRTTGQLRPESPCAKRKAAMNAMLSIKTGG